jgi:hypothetical protein
MPFDQTPLFQLNLMIFLAWPSSIAFVTPVFWNGGYTIDRIGQNIPTDLLVRTRVQEVLPPIPFNLSSSPDLILRHDENRYLMPIECKKESFGPDRDQAGQGAAMLSYNGPFLAGFLGLEDPGKWETFLYYAVTSSNESAMFDTLSYLATKLNGVSVRAAVPCTVGIDVRTDGIYLMPEPRSAHPITALNTASADGIKVMDIKAGQDPRPLYIIPLDPDWNAGDDYGKRALEERVRASLASLIASQLGMEEFEIEVEDLMRKTIEVWDIWRAQNAKSSIRGAVKKYVGEIFKEIRKVGVDVTLGAGKAVVRGVDPDRAGKIRHYLTSSSFRHGNLDLWSTAIQLEFGSLSEEW